MQRTPEDAAEGLLRFMWPDRRLPVDPVQIARDLGIQVFEAALNENMSGSIVKNAGQDPVILVNERDSRLRQRFSCAHELGHFVDQSSKGEDEVFSYIAHRGPLASEGTDSIEIQANQFAAALLMPADLVREHHAKGMTALQLARLFGVSADAMGFRLIDRVLARR